MPGEIGSCARALCVWGGEAREKSRVGRALYSRAGRVPAVTSGTQVVVRARPGTPEARPVPACPCGAPRCNKPRRRPALCSETVVSAVAANLLLDRTFPFF